MNDKIWLLNFLAIIICGLMLLRPAGYVFNSPILDQIGKSLVFSPLPMPFRQVAWMENYVVKRTFHFVTDDDQVLSIAETSELENSFPGPHRYHIALFNILNWGPFISTAAAGPVYNYLFCEGYGFGGVPTDVESVYMEYSSKRTGMTLTTIYHECY